MNVPHPSRRGLVKTMPATDLPRSDAVPPPTGGVLSRKNLIPPLRPYQRQIARAVLRSVLRHEGLSFSVLIARQGGKNELSAQIELALLLLGRAGAVEAIKCAPTFEPQCRISLRRLWQRLCSTGLQQQAGMAALEDGNSVRLGLARQRFLSAEPGAHVVGHTAHTLLEVDEAQDVDPDKFAREFRPMAATTNATMVYYGTAWDETCLLAQVREQHLELERRDGIKRHFEVDWQGVAAFNSGYAAYVAAERDRLGEEHPIFQTQYLLRTLAGAGRLFSPAALALLQGVHSRLTERPAAAPSRRVASASGGDAVASRGDAVASRGDAVASDPLGAGDRSDDAGCDYVGGLDVGGEVLQETRRDADSTVLTIARVLPPPALSLVQEPSLEVVAHYAWQGAGHAELAGAIAGLVRDRWRLRRLVVDATGVGEGLAASLASLSSGPEVVRLRLTQERKSQLGFALQAAAAGGRLRIYAADGSPEFRAMLDQLRRARAFYRPNRTLAFDVNPAEGHDDYLVSLALAVDAAAGLRPLVAIGRSSAF